MKAIRGAITVEGNSAEAIDEATQTLLNELRRRNQLDLQKVVAVFFTLTPDLTATFPARAAREIGWDVPMLDSQEVDVPGALVACVRALVLINGDGPVRHAYLHGASGLRPDLADGK